MNLNDEFIRLQVALKAEQHASDCAEAKYETMRLKILECIGGCECPCCLAIRALVNERQP